MKRCLDCNTYNRDSFATKGAEMELYYKNPLKAHLYEGAVECAKSISNKKKAYPAFMDFLF